MNNFKGWKKFWVAFAYFWTVAMLIGLDYSNLEREVIIKSFFYWVIPLIILYILLFILAWLIAWVRKGFKV